MRACVPCNTGYACLLQGASGFLGSPMEFKQLDSELQKPTDRRVWAIAKAFEQGYSVDRLHELTKVDRWFLQKCNNIMEVNKMVRRFPLP